MSNKIKRTKIDISFASENGFSIKGGYSSKNSDAMLDAVDELTRILAIEGRGFEVEEVVSDAISRVNADLNSRT